MDLFNSDILNKLYQDNTPFTNSRDDFIKTLVAHDVLNKIDYETGPERAKMFTYIMNVAKGSKSESDLLEMVRQMEEHGALAFWELPKPFEKQVPTQKFNPDSSLPDLLRDYIKAAADNVQVDVEMFILPLLSVLANCIHGKFRVCFPNSNHNEPLNLYTVTVASPGERKSGVFDTVTAALHAYQKRWNTENKGNIQEYQTKRKFLEKELEKATTGKNADINQALQIQGQLDSLTPVTNLTLNITDCTPESLTAELSYNNEVMGILDDECGIFGILAGLYSNGIANIDIFLKAYDGTHYVVTRRTKENIQLDRPVLTMGLMAQPDAFETAMNKPEFVGRGLMQRFLFAFPESKQGSRKTNSPPIPSNLREEYSKLIDYLLDIKMPAADEEPQVLYFSKNASIILDNYFYSIEDRLKEGGELVYMAEWANKLFAKCCRIAGILHVCKGKPTEPIDEATTMQAVHISTWAENQAHRAFSGTAFEDETTRNAKRILKKFKESKQDVYNRSEISRNNRTIKSNELDEALELLDNMRYIKIIVDKKNTAGRPKITVKVNPLIYDK